MMIEPYELVEASERELSASKRGVVQPNWEAGGAARERMEWEGRVE